MKPVLHILALEKEIVPDEGETDQTVSHDGDEVVH
jgi:hypothetical protein